MSRLLPICPGRRSFGALLPTVTLTPACVCVCVCVSGYGKEVNAALLCCWEPTRNYGHKSPKGIRKHSVTFGNKWEKGFFSRRTPRTFTFEMGCLFARGRGQWSKLVSTAFHIKPEPRQEFYGGWTQRQSKEKVSAARCRGTGVTLLTIKVTRAVCAWQR